MYLYLSLATQPHKYVNAFSALVLLNFHFYIK